MPMVNRLKISEKIHSIIHHWYSYEIKRATKILLKKELKLKNLTGTK